VLDPGSTLRERAARGLVAHPGGAQAAVTTVETLTILFSDLVDSTAIGVSLEPSVAVDLRNSLFALQLEEIDRHRGLE